MKNNSTRSWSKAEEIEWLETAIATLGPRSYLGPWLTEYRDQIVRDITVDVEPTAPMPSVASRQAIAIVTDAKTRADEIIGNAEKKRRELETAGYATVAAFRDSARRTLQALTDRV